MADRLTAGPSVRRFASVAVGVAALTLAGRIFGFGRSLVFSKTVGDTCLGDAYNTANNLPNVLFEVAAGGILANLVVPVVARQVAAGARSDAARTTSALLCWALLLLTPVGLLAVVAARFYAQVFSSADCAGGVEVTAALLVIFVPQLWFYALAVVSAGVLQAHHRFWAAAAAPLASSLVVIAAYLLYAAVSTPAARGDVTQLTDQALGVLGWGTTLGVVVLALTTMLPLLRSGIGLRPTLRFSPGVPAVIGRTAGAAVAGLVIQQLSVLIWMQAAQRSDIEGALTRAVWANAVYLLPFAVLVSPLQQMIFPRLSAAAERDHIQVQTQNGAEVGAHGSEVADVLKRIGPALAVLAVLGACLLVGCAIPVARILVLGPGSGDTAALALPIAAFAPALIGFSLMGLATRTLFAQHLARRAGITSVTAWTGVSLGALVVRVWVPGPWVVTGIGLATSLGMLAGAAVGWFLVRRGDGRAGVTSLGILRPVLRGLPVAAVVGGGCWWMAQGLSEAGVTTAVLGAVGCALGCTAVVVALFWLIDRRALRAVLNLRGLRGLRGQQQGEESD